MSYSLSALVCPPDIARLVAAELPLAALCALPQNLILLPLDLESYGTPDAPSWPGCFELPANLAPLLAQRSLAGPVAFIEAEYSGNLGGQTAVVWQHGQLAFGPATERVWWDGTRHREEGRGSAPINHALALLGAAATAGRDAFDTLGLGRHRSNAKWIAEARDSR